MQSRQGMSRMFLVAVSIGVVGCGESASDSPRVGSLGQGVSLNFPLVETIDYQVAVSPVAPEPAGAPVYVNVRERRAVNRNQGKVVLMIHGASVPVLAGFDLRADHYDWALWLAQSGGFDVFMLDLQGSGLSHRPPPMDDPCNVPLGDQTRALIPHQVAAPCLASYPFQLTDSRSDWAELDKVVDFIRALRSVERVNLIAWSQGSFRAGPYSVMHPDKVESLLLYAPIYNPVFRKGAGQDQLDPPLGVTLPQPGTPMTLRTKADLMGLWDAEGRCEGQVEEGIQDLVWDAIMDNETLGRTWGPPPAGAFPGSPPEGILRVRTPFLWGWNQDMAAQVAVPLLIIQGEFDLGTGAMQKLAELYRTVQSTRKLRFRVQCAGHFMVWESRRRTLQHVSKEWIEHGSVAGFETGEFYIDNDDNLLPL